MINDNSKKSAINWDNVSFFIGGVKQLKKVSVKSLERYEDDIPRDLTDFDWDEMPVKNKEKNV